MAKRRWHVPTTECRKTGARAHGTSKIRLAEAHLDHTRNVQPEIDETALSIDGAMDQDTTTITTPAPHTGAPRPANW
eukprot:CAMPEP_0172598114 /NCGR_PEP_ID=MMETSP1068-20121228/18118_1 /TAXON_ID=35684 /ORGANISM="Pseudopedinella elastica, Strain CCMP716" /LENGTH=76 /DNA_ID=CAMNT_0013397853 /DNA_START=129 /DNA_END=357 /DNA_ORIENTATION=-